MKATKLLFTVMSSLIVICSLISAQSIASEKVSNVINLNKNGIDGSKLAMASAPPLYELELTSLSGEIHRENKFSQIIEPK